MDAVLETLGKNLDIESENLLSWGRYTYNEMYADDAFFDFTELVKKILRYLGAADMERYPWHSDIDSITFRPTRQSEKWIIGTGFDEIVGPDKEDEGPDLVVLPYGDSYSMTKIFDPKDWRLTLGEFFDFSKIDSYTIYKSI